MSKTKRIKARRMWADYDAFSPRSSAFVCNTGAWRDEDDIPVAVLDMSDPDALIEQAARGLLSYSGRMGPPLPDDLVKARHVLTVLGIIPPAKKPKAKTACPQYPVEFENAELGDEG